MVYCLSSSPRLFRCQGRWLGEGAVHSTECSTAGYQYFHMSLSDLMWSEWGSQVGPPDGSPGYLYPGPCLRSLCFDLLHCVFASVRPRAGVCSLYRLFFFSYRGGGTVYPVNFAFVLMGVGNCRQIYGQFLAPVWAKVRSTRYTVGGFLFPRSWTICLGEWVTFAVPDAHSPSQAY